MAALAILPAMTTETLQALAAVVIAAWGVTARMAPYLLFGFAVAGLLYVLLPADWVARHLGDRGWRPPLKAALFGIPLPLCSCGVVPVAMSLRRQGASRGATAAFLMSTPQTGVDSMLVTYGLLGPVIAAIRPLAALVSGVLCGWTVDVLSTERDAGMGGGPDSGRSRSATPWWQRAVRHGFITLPGDIGRELLVGLLIAGALGALIPPDFFRQHVPPGWPSYGLMLAVGIPMYVCSTASVPIAMGLIQAGISPGAAMVFLITGPATNAATLSALRRILGRGATGAYLACLTATALATGGVLDRWLLPAFPDAAPVCHIEGPAPGGHAAAAVLLVVLALGWRTARRRAPANGGGTPQPA